MRYLISAGKKLKIMSQEFNTIISYVEKMKERYFFALSTFYAYEALREILAPNIVGQEVVEKNVEIFKKFNEFFGPSKEALRVYFFLELAKLFDVSDQSLHITKVINYTQSNIAKLTASDFTEYNQNREFIDSLIENYQGVKHDDLVIIKSEIEKNKDIIEKVKTYRDQYLAHDDIKKVEVNITGEEIRILFSVLEKILNTFSSKLISATSIYNHVETDAKGQTMRIFDHLKRFEPYRLKEIDEKYKKDLEKYQTK